MSILYIGWDKHHGFQLYQSDPSGNYGGWKATCIGNNSAVSIMSFTVLDLVDNITVKTGHGVLRNVAWIEGCSRKVLRTGTQKEQWQKFIMGGAMKLRCQRCWAEGITRMGRGRRRLWYMKLINYILGPKLLQIPKQYWYHAVSKKTLSNNLRVLDGWIFIKLCSELFENPSMFWNCICAQPATVTLHWKEFWISK